MKPLDRFSSSHITYVFTDIDGTLTTSDKITADTYQSLWSLKNNGVEVIPVTGRPAGWCELIARQWPVHGVIGENGAFYFRHSNHEMKRHFFSSPEDQKTYRSKLKQIESEVLSKVARSKIASDQFSRLFDLAIDFAEDVTPPLSNAEISQIVQIF